MVFEVDLGSSVSCVNWSPPDYGLVIAAGTVHGAIRVYRAKQIDRDVTFQLH